MKKYILLEDSICYDWDDYGVYGAVLYDIKCDCITIYKYGHGTDLAVRDECMSLNEAVEGGFITLTHMIDVMVRSLNISFSNADIPSLIEGNDFMNPIGIPVEVTGGRKFKGSGYLVGSIKEPVRYGLGAWHNEYNHKYIVYSPEKNDYFLINSFAYISFNEETIKAWNIAVRDVIEDSAKSVYNLAHAWAYDMSYSSCDSKNYHNLVRRYSNGGIKSFKEVKTPDILVKAAEKKAEEARAAREKKMNEELPSLIEWVRSKGYKETEEDIIAEAKRIWNKRN